MSDCVCTWALCGSVREELCALLDEERAHPWTLTRCGTRKDCGIVHQITLASSHINEEGLQKAMDVVGATAEGPLRMCVCVRAWTWARTLPPPRRRVWDSLGVSQSVCGCTWC